MDTCSCYLGLTPTLCLCFQCPFTYPGSWSFSWNRLLWLLIFQCDSGPIYNRQVRFVKLLYFSTLDGFNIWKSAIPRSLIDFSTTEESMRDSEKKSPATRYSDLSSVFQKQMSDFFLKKIVLSKLILPLLRFYLVGFDSLPLNGIRYF